MSELSAKSKDIFAEDKKPDYLENGEPRYYSDDENEPIELDTQNKSETYEFKPTVGPDGVIDYTAVHADKVYLVNKKDILNKELPSYLPPVEIRRNGSYEIPAIKTGANEYLIKGENTFPGPVYEMSFASKETLKETMTAGKIYKVNLDVLTALTNYHLEYEKALNKAVAARNEESRKLAVIRGKKYFEAIKKNSFPNIPKPVKVY